MLQGKCPVCNMWFYSASYSMLMNTHCENCGTKIRAEVKDDDQQDGCSEDAGRDWGS